MAAALIAGLGGSLPVFSQTTASSEQQASALPSAIDGRGERPEIDLTRLPAAADTLPAGLESLAAPEHLALPDQADQVRVVELRPLTLDEVLLLAEVNSPQLKSAESQVEQAASALRAAISSWYPTVDLSANGLPQYFKSFTYRNPDFVPQAARETGETNPLTGEPVQELVDGKPETYGREWRADLSVRVAWNLIDPARVPQIAAARDTYERSRASYAIALRDLRLRTATAYFTLQEADEGVRIGQASVHASLVSLRDARARFNAGVNTKLEVLEAETQLARDRNLLTGRLANQSVARRSLAQILDLPQDITPTAATPASPLGLWDSSLEESILAAYDYREELDQLLLDISIGNSRANASLAAIQPVISFVNNFSVFRNEGQTNINPRSDIDMDDYRWGKQNTTSLTATWRLFDGGRAKAEYRRFKQSADQSAVGFADARGRIRLEVEESFINLRTAIQNMETTTSEVLSSRESLRLSQLRVQAGVSTQREVVDNQRDLTNAELRYAQAIREYNTSLAELRRRTGLDTLLSCSTKVLPAQKPEGAGTSVIPIEPTPLKAACSAAADEQQ